MTSASRLASRACRALALVCRVAAWALAALVVADAVLPAGPRAALLGVNGAVSRAVPAALSGLFVLQTPLGGAFRGDFALLAACLLLTDWALCRVSSWLR